MADDAMHFLVDEGTGLVVRDAGTALTAALPATSVTIGLITGSVPNQIAAQVSAGLAPAAISTTPVPAPVQTFRTNDGAKWKRGTGLRQRSDSLGGTFSLDTSDGEVRADWLGAALDGVVDDAPAINAGLALGLRVTVPYGKTAAIGSKLIAGTAGAVLAGFATVKLLASYLDDFIVGIGAPGCRVESLLFDGRAVTAFSRWALSGIVATASLATLTLDGVTVMGVPFNGIGITNNGGSFTHGRVKVRDCTVLDAGWAGMSFEGIAKLNVADHTISATGYTALNLGPALGDVSIAGGEVSRAAPPSTIYSGPGNPNVDTSTTSRTIVSSGSVAFTITRNASAFTGFYPGKVVTVHAGTGGPTGTQNKTTFMRGTVTSYTGSVVTLTVTASGGAGTYANWTLFGEVGGLLGWLPPIGSLEVRGGKYSDCQQGGYDGFLLGEDGVGTTFGPTVIMGVRIDKVRGGGIDMTSNMKVIGCDIRDTLNPILFTLDLGGVIRDASVIGCNFIDAGSITGNNGSAIRFARAAQGQNILFQNIVIEGNTVRGATATLYAIAFDNIASVGYQDVTVKNNIFTQVAGESFTWTGNFAPPSGISFANNEVKAPGGAKIKTIAATSGVLYPFGYEDYLLVSSSATNVTRIVDGTPGHNYIRVLFADSNTTLTPDWPASSSPVVGDRLLMPANTPVTVGGGSLVGFERQDPSRGWYAEIKRPYA